MQGFNSLLEKISSGAAVGSDEVLPYISQEDFEKRLWANLKLAEAYSQLQVVSGIQAWHC